MRLLLILLFLSCLHHSLSAKILHTGHGQRYVDIATAAKAAVPGDTILVHNGTYRGDQSLQSLQGISGKWIYIIAEKNGAVLFEGGATAWSGTQSCLVRHPR